MSNSRSRFTNYIKWLSNWRKAGYTATVLLILTIMAILFPISLRSATPVEGATKGATASTLTFTSNTSSTSASLSVSNTSGSFTTSSSNASFSIETNNATGYTLNLKTSNNTTTLSDGNNHTIPSIETSKTASNFTNNAWGLLPSKYNGTANTTNYYPASSNGFTMDTTSSSNTGNANTYTVGLGLKADYTIPAGTYTNTTIVAEYVANPITYAIYYYANTTDTVTGMPSPNPQVPASSFPGTTATTTNLASAPTRTGYTFLGWCLGASNSSNITVGTSGNADACGNSSTNQFTAGQSFGINATGSSPDLYYFYAMWQANTYTVTISNSNTTSSVASLTIPYGGSATVTVTPASGYYLSSVSCPSGYTCTGYTTTTSSTGVQTVTVTNNNTVNGGTLSFAGSLPPIYMQEMTMADCKKNVSNDIGENVTVYDKRDGKDYMVKYINGECWMTQNLRFTGTSVLAATSNVTADKTLTYYQLDTDGDASGEKCYSTNGYSNACIKDSGDTTKGVWYNYMAATAGIISGTSTSTVASQDICPKNWHLPSGPNTTANTDINKLVGSTTSGWQNPTTGLTAFSAVAGGSYYNGSLSSTGYGYWWSATADTPIGRYVLVYNSSNGQFNGDYGDTRYRGFFVRCVYGPTMQSATSAYLAAVMPNVGDTTTLVDVRDGQEYTIGKLADNKYWMLDNLALDLTNTNVQANLTSTTTNATDTSISKLLNGGGTTSNKYPTAKLNNVAWTSSSQNYYSIPMMVSSGTCYDDYCVNNPSSGNWSFDATLPATINGVTSRVQGKIGIYYNYCAASAGSYCYGNGTSGGTSSGNASEDICPYGWRLPAGGTAQGSFYYLYNTGYSANYNNFVDALSTPLSGHFSSGKAYFQGNNGRFWSSTRNSNNSMYSLYVVRSSADPQSNTNRYAGNSVRCVIKTS